FVLRDDLSVSPESSFGGLFTGVPGSLESPILPGLDPSIPPSETILTGRTNRINNTTLAEIDYSLSRRSSLTFSGSYGLLHFQEPGFLGRRTVNGRMGYNYALSAKNSLGFIYDFTETHFTGTIQAVTSHSTQLAFGRKVTGRLAFELSAGPELILLRNYGVG